MIPHTFEEWKSCIINDCKIDLTVDFAQKRLAVYSDKNINLSSANDIFSIGVDSIFVDNPLDLLGKF